MSDLISRQAALDIIDSELNGWLTDDERLHLEGVAIGIECLPRIDQVKHGKWKLVGSTTIGDPFGAEAWGKMYRCSECGFAHHVLKDSKHYKFCPVCGANMGVTDD